jgi:hypothetical protein
MCKPKLRKKFMQTKKIITSLALSLIFFTGMASVVRAEGEETQIKKVEYNGEVIVDSDLDGLTDKGEQQIFNTDPGNQDSDSDGYLDGAEVLSETIPTDAVDYPTHRTENIPENTSVQTETPWAWYVARSAGLIGYLFLWITIFLGLSIRNPILKRIIEPIYSFDFHCFTAASAIFWALVHGSSLLFDKSVGFSAGDVLIPFFYREAVVDVDYLALGIMAFYMMAIMTITSYLRRHIKNWIWRVLHFLSPVAFIFTIIHGYSIGTDMKNFYIGGAYLASSFVLLGIYILSLGMMIWNKLRPKQVV